MLHLVQIKKDKVFGIVGAFYGRTSIHGQAAGGIIWLNQ